MDEVQESPIWEDGRGPGLPLLTRRLRRMSTLLWLWFHCPFFPTSPTFPLSFPHFNPASSQRRDKLNVSTGLSPHIWNVSHLGSCRRTMWHVNRRGGNKSLGHLAMSHEASTYRQKEFLKALEMRPNTEASFREKASSGEIVGQLMA